MEPSTHLIQHILVLRQMWTSEQMFDDTEVQNLIPDGHTDPPASLNITNTTQDEVVVLFCTMTDPNKNISIMFHPGCSEEDLLILTLFLLEKTP